MGASISFAARQHPPVMAAGLALSVLAVLGIVGFRMAPLLLLAFWGLLLVFTIVMTFMGHGHVFANVMKGLLYVFFALVSLAGYEPVGEDIHISLPPQQDVYINLLEPPLLIL